ncbi:MAG: SBBP repeat-containing protein [Candidatus Hydrogenedentes bacterium]|nr:SBBP repeat-containing protein [Candidatus Hydrogenedentota bacterium]
MRNPVGLYLTVALGIFQFVVPSATADTITHEWALGMGSPDSDAGQEIALDQNRSVYVVGYFQGTVDFDPGLQEHELTAVAEADAYVLKLNSDGKFQWVRQVGGSGTEIPYALELDADGNIYVAGTFTETADFNPGAGTANRTAKGDPDNFVLKLNSAGDFIWAKQLGGKTGQTYGLGSTLDGDGNIYLIGHFYGSVDFDPGDQKEKLESVGSSDIFIVKLDADGNLNWVNQIGSATSEFGSDLVVDLNGFVYVAGAFSSTVDLDPGPDIDVASTNGGYDSFVAKFDFNGNHIWSNAFGGTGDEIVRRLALDNNRDVYASGRFDDSVVFNIEDAVTSQGGSDVFLIKLSSETSSVIAADSMGGLDDEDTFALCADNEGNAYVGGAFEGTAHFNPGPDTVQFDGAGGRDIFQAKYLANGDFAWAFPIGGLEFDFCAAITVDTVGNTYCTGQFSDSVVFDPNPSFLAPLVSEGNTDLFVFKLNFFPNGSVSVKLKPKGARRAGAAWRLDNAPPWRKHKDLVNDVSPGQHTIQFKAVSGHQTPTSKTINVDANEIESVTGKYKKN